MKYRNNPQDRSEIVCCKRAFLGKRCDCNCNSVKHVCESYRETPTVVIYSCIVCGEKRLTEAESKYNCPGKKC